MFAAHVTGFAPPPSCCHYLPLLLPYLTNSRIFAFSTTAQTTARAGLAAKRPVAPVAALSRDALLRDVLHTLDAAAASGPGGGGVYHGHGAAAAAPSSAPAAAPPSSASSFPTSTSVNHANQLRQQQEELMQAHRQRMAELDREYGFLPARFRNSFVSREVLVCCCWSVVVVVVVTARSLSLQSFPLPFLSLFLSICRLSAGVGRACSRSGACPHGFRARPNPSCK